MTPPPPTVENGHPLALDHARWWHRLGFRPVRVRAGGQSYQADGYDPATGERRRVTATAAGKEAFDPGWQTANPTAEELDRLFARPVNVGVLTGAGTGNGHAVTDWDCAEAVRAAPLLLPPTPLKTGRASAGGRSHWHYKVIGEFPHLSVEDPDGKGKIAELLGDKHDCTVYGTYTRKDGDGTEPCIIGEVGEPAVVSADELVRAFRRLLATVTIARRFPTRPADGNRHDVGFAVIGMLIRYGYAADDAARFMAAVCAATGHAELLDRTATGEWVREADSTADRLASGQGSVFGIPKFRELVPLSDKAFQKVLGWLGIDATGPTATAGGQAVGRSKRWSEGSVVGSSPSAAKARPLPPWKPFPTDLLPPVLARYVRETAEAMDRDEAYSAGPVIAAASLAVGCTHLISPKRGWKEPCAAWIVSIGPSSTTKSPPYRDVEDMCQDINDRLEREYEVAVCQYEQAVAEWTSNEGEGEKPVPPVEKAFIKSDVTIPALVPELKNNPRGILIGRDELIAWIGNFTRHSGKTGATELQDWLQLSNAGVVDVIRKTDRFRVRVRGVAVGVFGTTQPGVIAKALTPELKAAGLFARLLPLYPPVRKRKWTDAEVDEGTRQDMADLIDKLFALEMGEWEDKRPRSHLVTLSPAAKAKFVEFYNRNGEVMFTADDDHRAAMGKIEGYALRFALLFHCCRHPDNPSAHKVGGEDMTNAVKLADWFIAESERVYQMLGESEEERAVRTLAEQVHRKAAKLGGRISIKQLQNSNSRRYTTAAVAEGDLQMLVDAGFGTWSPPEPTGKGGHAVVYYVPTDSLPTTDPSDPRSDEGGGGGSDPRSDPRPDRDGKREHQNDATNTESTASDEMPEPSPEQGSEESVVGSDSNGGKPPPTAPEQESDGGERPSEATAAVRGFKWASELSGPAYMLVTDTAGLADVEQAMRDSERVGLDLETTGLSAHSDKIRLLSLHTERGTFLVDCFAVDPVPLFDALAASEIVGHNLLFDLGFLARLGFTPGGVSDSMLASQILDAGTPATHGLKDAAGRHLGRAVDKTEQKSRWAGDLSESQLTYAAADAELPLALMDALTPKLAEAKLAPVVGLESRALPAVAWMASKGIGFDRAGWQALADEAEG